MRNIFLDTNVIIDFLGDRKPFSKFALRIFERGYNQEIELWTSSNSITTAYYILDKLTNRENAFNLIAVLLTQIKVQAVTHEHLVLASQGRLIDFEDGVQHYCALSIKQLETLVTRNKKDFKNSSLNVIAPDEFQRWLEGK